MTGGELEKALTAALVSSAQSTNSRNLSILRERKLAEAFLDPADGRRRLVRLTAAGLALVRALP